MDFIIINRKSSLLFLIIFTFILKELFQNFMRFHKIFENIYLKISKLFKRKINLS